MATTVKSSTPTHVAPLAVAKVPSKKRSDTVARKPVSIAKTPKPQIATPAKVSAKATLKTPATPKAEKPLKVKKPKLVRDSFTIPKAEYGVLDELKQRAGKLASPAKKSELLRAGVKALAAMSDTAFLAAVKAVPTIKTGRPAKSKGG